MRFTWRALLATATVTVTLLPAPTLAQQTRTEQLLEDVRGDHVMLEDELETAANERLRNAERLTRLETLAEENSDRVQGLRAEVATLRARVRDLSDSITSLLTTLLVGALGTISVLLPMLFTLLRRQRTTRTEVRQAKQQLERTHQRVEYVAEAVNGSTNT